MSDTKNLTLLGANTTDYSASYDPNILETFENKFPQNKYEVKLNCPEFTHICPKTGQPDFATIYILMYPNGRIVELKSLKMYLQQYRDVVISYERLLNQLYDHMQEVYTPQRLRLVLDCNSRGGMSSRLTIDSDWEVLGGEDKYKNWREDTW